MKKWKRLVALSLSLMLVSGTIFANNFMQADARTFTTLFEDDFDAYSPTLVNVGGQQLYDLTPLKNKGWKASSNTNLRLYASYANNGVFKIPAKTTAPVNMVLGNYNAAKNWKNYTIDADVTFNSDNENAVSGKYTWAFISGRETGVSDTGWSLALGATHEGKVRYVRLVKNGKGIDADQYDDNFGAIDYATANRIAAGTKINVKLEFNETQVVGYLNGTKVVAATMASKDVAAGYVGIHTKADDTQGGGVDVTIDNFKVNEYYSMTDQENYYYYNNFDSDTYTIAQEGWTGSVSKSNGAMVLPASKNGFLTNVEGSSSWTDYIVETQVKIKSDKGAVTGQTSVIVRSTSGVNSGYELRMRWVNSGNIMDLRLNKMGEKGFANTYAKNISIELDQLYNISIAVCDNHIMCWFAKDGEEAENVFDVYDEDNPFLSGYAGVMAVSSSKYLDSEYNYFHVRPYVEPEVEYPDGYFYYNEFESGRALNKEGWSNAGTKKDGAFILEKDSYNYLTGVEGSSEWKDYVVETNVKIPENEGLAYSSIAARVTEKAKNGYEFRIVREDNGKTYVELYKRGISSGKINGEDFTMDMPVITNEWNSMKIVVQGSRILCYFNGMKVFDVIDTYGDEKVYDKGFAGVMTPKTATNNTHYEYFAVREVLPTDIVEEDTLQKPDGNVWFYDDFTDDNAFTDRGWHTDVVEVYNSSVNLDGRLLINGIEGTENWTDYEVEGIVYVDKEAGPIGDATLGMACVCARTAGANAYEFGILTPEDSKPYLRLYNRYTGETLAQDTSKVISDGDHKITMVCSGKTISCYLDDEFVFSAQSDSASAGFAAIRSSGFPAYWKSVTVRAVTPRNALVLPTVTSPTTGQTMNMMATISLVVFVISTLGLVVTLGSKRKFS